MDTSYMRAAVLVAPRQLAIKTVPVPEPGPEQVRVRLEGCGVCGSNLAPYEGRPWFQYPRDPGDPGHEGWGEIDALGSNVQNLRRGERVALLSYRAYAEYDVAEGASVVKLPPSLEKKPFPGEALGCAINVFRRCDISAGDNVAIVGIGFMGALLTSLASSAGAQVIAITRRPFALDVARQMGAQHLIPMNDHWKIVEQVKGLTNGAGCERVIEAAGAQWPLDLAGELTRERGKLIIAGYHQDGPRQVNMQLWNWRGLDVINAHEREARVYQDGMRAAVETVASGRLNPAPLYTHTFALEEINDAFETMAARPDNFMKAVIKL
jgi:threonine dehydrogenase-like Zn-dependent dehydrogenase